MQQQYQASVAKTAAVAPDPYRDLAPFVPSAQNPWDEAKAAHLMRRAAFGPRPEDLPAMVVAGMSASVDKLLNTSGAGLVESGYVRLSNGEQYPVQSRYGSRAQWVDAMLTSVEPAVEKMTLFWSDHFSVGTKMAVHERLLVRYTNVLRQYGFGRFRDLLLEVTKDPAMLWWLDNNVNGQPENGAPKINENYGRELLELFTMGVDGGYTQQDVREAAKCLSGWSTAAVDAFVYKPTWHVIGDKFVLGRRIYSNGQREVLDLLDTILGHPATARFIVTKIWKYFVSEDPYPQLINLLAHMWRQSGYDIRSLMSTIFKSNYFYSERAVQRSVKNPVEFVIQALRATNAPWRSYRLLDTRLVQMGYRLLEYKDPSGYEDGVAWIDEMALVARANFANDMTRVNGMALFDPNREINLHNLNSAKAVVDHYIRILGLDHVPPPVRNIAYLFMDLVDTGPEPFTFTASKVQEKVRGLVHLLLSLPEASIH